MKEKKLKDYIIVIDITTSKLYCEPNAGPTITRSSKDILTVPIDKIKLSYEHGFAEWVPSKNLRVYSGPLPQGISIN